MEVEKKDNEEKLEEKKEHACYSPCSDFKRMKIILEYDLDREDR